jgi:hypothetical protein
MVKKMHVVRDQMLIEPYAFQGPMVLLLVLYLPPAKRAVVGKARPAENVSLIVLGAYIFLSDADIRQGDSLFHCSQNLTLKLFAQHLGHLMVPPIDEIRNRRPLPMASICLSHSAMSLASKSWQFPLQRKDFLF